MGNERQVRTTVYTKQGTIYSYLSDYWEDMELGESDDESSDLANGVLEGLSQSDDCPPALFREDFAKVEVKLVED